MTGLSPSFGRGAPLDAGNAHHPADHPHASRRAALCHEAVGLEPHTPGVAADRLRGRRHTCNVECLALRRCTVTYMQTRQPSPPPPSPLAVTEKRAAAICTPPLNPLSQILPIRRFGPCISSPIHHRRYSPPIPFFLSIENIIF